MKNLYKTILTLIVVLTISQTANATHLAGVDFNYQCVGQDSFLITLSLFRDCSGIGAPSSASIDFANTCGTSFIQNLTLQNPGGTGASQLCSSSLSNSSCNGGALPGMQHYIYSGIVVLNSNCNNWTMSWSSCCRNSSVNLIITSFTEMYIDASLVSSVSSCNNSPVFSDNYIRYVPINQSVSHSFTVFEPDGDSLVYHFSEPLGNYGSNVSFNFGYYYQQPIPGITLDTETGLVDFTPITLGNFVVAIEVCEYEYGTGLLKGCVTRDIEYVVINSTNSIVQFDSITNVQGGGVLVGPYDIEMCSGDSVSFDIIFTDPDTGDSISIISNIANVLQGASISSTGGNPDTVSVNWVSQGYLTQVNAFSITASDDACPVYSSISIPINIHLLTSTYAGPDQTICLGTEWASLTAVGESVFNWNVLSGSPIDTNSASPNFNMTCANCQYPQVSPAVSTTYLVTSNVTGGCATTDTITVNVAPDFTLTMPNDTLICSVDDFQLNAFTNQPFSYNYQWSPSYLLDYDTVSQPITNPSNPTTYSVTVTSNSGCSKSDNLKLTLSAPFPKNNFVIGDTIVCFGSTSQLSIGFGDIDYGGCDTSSSGCNGNTFIGVIGTDTTSNNVNQYPAVYGGQHWGAKHRIIYRASELTSMGMGTGGLLNSIGFFVSTLGTVPGYTDFTIKIGCSSELDVNGVWPGNLTTVHYSSIYYPSIGWNQHICTTPFVWDGLSSIMIEVCFNNIGSAFNNAILEYTATGYHSVLINFGDNSNVCSNHPANTVSNRRPNTRFNFCTGIDPNALTYNWLPASGLSATNIQNPIAIPSANSNYQVIVTDPQGLCKDTLYHSLDVVNQFDAGFNTQSPYCVSATLDTLLPNVGNGVFTGNGVNSLGIFDPTLAGVGIWPINYSITSPAACANDSTINVEVLALPNASIQYQEVCYNSSPVTLIPNTAGGIFSGPGIIDSVNGVFDATILSPGTYPIEYAITQFCFNSVVTGIKVIEPYDFTFDQNIVNLCQDETLDLTSNYMLSTNQNQGSGPVHTFWSDANGYIDSNGVFDATGVVVGNYFVELSVTDSNGGCGTSKNMTVSVRVKDYPQFPNGLIFCETDGQVNIIVTPWLFGVGATFTQTPIAPLSSNDSLLISPFGTNGKFNTIISGIGSWEFAVSYTNINGCTGVTYDTIYVLPVPFSDSVIQNQTVLTAVLGGYDYQWLDCNNNMAPVPGATNQSFTPAVTGDYAVEISTGNCSITSGCYYGWSVGVEEAENDLGVSIFPNPTKEAIQIDKGNNENVKIEIIGFTGKIIWQQSLENQVTTIDLGSYSSGVYLVKITSERGTVTQKIVKN